MIDHPVSLLLNRKALRLTQAEMAERMGLSMRGYQDIETGKAELRKIHILAFERAALTRAIESSKPMSAPPSIRKDALDLARLITEG